LRCSVEENIERAIRCGGEMWNQVDVREIEIHRERKNIKTIIFLSDVFNEC
jgi:hypothetical protein